MKTARARGLPPHGRFIRPRPAAYGLERPFGLQRNVQERNTVLVLLRENVVEAGCSRTRRARILPGRQHNKSHPRPCRRRNVDDISTAADAVKWGAGRRPLETGPEDSIDHASGNPGEKGLVATREAAGIQAFAACTASPENCCSSLERNAFCLMQSWTFSDIGERRTRITRTRPCLP